MISAIVFVEFDPATDAVRAREHVVRSLVWLVSAAVAGVIRDVVLASGPAIDVADIADLAGCTLVQSASRAALVRDAVARCRGEWILALRSGYQPDGLLVEELDSLVAPHRPPQSALLLAAPEGLVRRLMPSRALAVGVLGPRSGMAEAGSFRDIVRSIPRGRRLRTRMRPVP